MKGIDISSYQSRLNIAGTDADFVIVKASEGLKYKSSTMARQADATLTSGKRLGLYFYSNGKGVNKEVDFFLSSCSSYIGKGILCLDWESSRDASIPGYNPEFLAGNTAYVLEFLDKVKEKTGSIPFLYTGLYETNSRNYSAVAKKYPLWGACYASTNPSYWQEHPWKEGAKWGAWGTDIAIRQYIGTGGRVKGYSGDVDLNKAYISGEVWDSYAHGTAQKGKISPIEAKEAVMRKFVRRGDSGDLVRALQALLRVKGYELTIDGLFGPATEAAVRDYQKSNKDTSGNHLAVDGIAGPLTFASLAKL